MKNPILVLLLVAGFSTSLVNGAEYQLLTDAPAGFVHIRAGDERDSGPDIYLNTAQIVSVHVSGDRQRPGSSAVVVITMTASDDQGRAVQYIIPFRTLEEASNATIRILNQTQINRSE